MTEPMPSSPSALTRARTPLPPTPLSATFSAQASPVAAAGVRARDWWRLDSLCSHVASFFTRPRDAANFEAALGRKVTGLWTDFNGLRLRAILAPEIARQRRLGHRRSAASEGASSLRPPDMEMRELCKDGLRENDLAAMAPARIRALHKRLTSETWQDLPLVWQVERERWLRQCNDFGQLRKQWHDYLQAISESYDPRAALARHAQQWPSFASEHRLIWQACLAWLDGSPADKMLEQTGTKFFTCLLAVNAELAGAHSARAAAASMLDTSAMQELGPLLHTCLNALDAVALEQRLHCPLAPQVLPLLAAG